MARQPVYHEGRFVVPPRFDFKFLPLRGEKITVVSFIGYCDFFLGDLQLSNVFAYSGRSIPFPAYVEGYYDCENQLVFLVFNTPDSDVFEVRYNNSKESNTSLNYSESIGLKLWFYAFSISHFVVLTSVGTNLDPRYIRILKLLNQMSVGNDGNLIDQDEENHMPCISCKYVRLMLNGIVVGVKFTLMEKMWSTCYHIRYNKTCTASSMMHSNWNLTVAVLSPDLGMVRKLERNIVSQIFNTFYELGLLNKTPASQLFILPGHNFVHVQLGNEYINESGSHVCQPEETSQKYLEQISGFLGLSTKLNLNTVESKNQEIAPSFPTAWDFPCPDQPSQHTLSAFLRLHVETMLDQSSSQNPTSTQSPVIFKLPTCKAWFMACYKLYTSLMAEDGMSNQKASDTAITKDEPSVCLSQVWKDSLTAILIPPTVSTPAFAARDSTKSSSLQKTLSGDDDFNFLNDPNLPSPEYLQNLLDPMVRLSVLRYRFASVAAETHYKQDLPLHYSHAYHLMKMVSAFNVAISLTRGQHAFHMLRKLSSRLAHLYLAGRVTCPAISLTGQPCQYELHRLPDEAGALSSFLSSISKHEKYEESEHSDDRNAPFGRTPPVNPAHSTDFKLAAENLILNNLTGKWKRYWIVSAIDALNSNRTTNQSGTDLERISHDNQADEQSAQVKQHLAVMPHRSDTVFISSCNCGRQQAKRLDPFDYKDANWGFYSLLASVCCNELNYIELAPQILCDANHPFCLPKTYTETYPKTKIPNAGDDQDNDGTANSENILEQNENSREPTSKMNSLSPNVPLLVAQEQSDQERGLSQPDRSDLSDTADSDQSDSLQENIIHKSSSDSSHMGRNRKKSADSDALTDELLEPFCAPDTSSEDSEHSEIPRSKAKDKIKKQTPVLGNETKDTNPDNMPKTQGLYPVIFRDGIPTTNWKIGEMPRYPSWSIYALGKYFVYSHSSGLPYLGFLRNSNYLLPWDVVIGTGGFDKRHTNTTMTKYRPGRTESGIVKLFIGFEMECRFGHRFFITGPDQAMDGPIQSSQVRQAVRGLLTRDLPLFMVCPYHRSGSQTLDTLRHHTESGEWEMTGSSVGQSSSTNGRSTAWAQLSRIYLAIPVAPVRVRFEPRIRPGPAKSTPIFHLGPTLDQCYEGAFDPSMDSDEMASDPDEDIHSNIRRGKAQAKRSYTHNSGELQKPGFVLLDNGYFWVIRLPFVYHDGTTLYEKPTDPTKIGEWKLLRGSMQLQL